MKRKICLVILILLLYSLQGTFCKAISLGGISPNLLIIIPICFGYFKGCNEGMFAGVVAGLMFDLYYTSIYGFSALAFCYAGYFAGIFQREYNEQRILIPMLITGGADFCYEFFIYLGGFLLQNKLNLLFYAVKIIFPSVVYTMIACFILFKPLLMCNKLFEPKEKRKVSDYVKGND